MFVNITFTNNATVNQIKAIPPKNDQLFLYKNKIILRVVT